MGEKNLNKKILSGIIWSYGERLLAQFITLIVSIILARILSPKDYGIIAIVTVFITICDALVSGGFGNALVQKKDATDLDFNSICWVSISMAIILYIGLFLSAPVIADFYEMPVLVSIIQIMGIRFIFSAFNSIQQAYVQRHMIFRKFFFATLGGTLFSAVLGIGMAVWGFGIWALVVQYLSSTIVNTIILFLTIEWKPKVELSWKSVKELWNFGYKILISTIVYTIKDNIRSLIIGKEFTSSDLAFYNQGQKFPSLLVTDIVESLGMVMFPVFSARQDNRLRIKELMRKSIRISSYILTPCIIGLYAISDTFVSVILTDKWLPCVPYMRILCIVYVTRSMSTIFQKCVLAIGKSNVNLLHEIVTSILTIILLLLAALKFENIYLIAWSYVIVMFFGICIYGYFIHQYFKYKFIEFLFDYLPIFIMSTLMGLVVYAIGFIELHSILKFVLQIIVGFFIYFAFSVLLKNEGFLYIKKILEKYFFRKNE